MEEERGHVVTERDARFVTMIVMRRAEGVFHRRCNTGPTVWDGRGMRTSCQTGCDRDARFVPTIVILCIGQRRCCSAVATAGRRCGMEEDGAHDYTGP